MDEKTKQLRARNKQLAGKRGELPQFELRGLGQARKPAKTFPLKQCEHIDGGKKITFRRKRADGTTYLVSIVRGGNRCPNTVLVKNRCSAHLQ
jgi:hypothetical protein